ncbi:hypothetical protein HU762_22485 [Pseudomonas sp. SWRI92]|uniref:Uncharacterized protein n=1 Tax=Pseudomonas marvdashtae TaxID=2745500 RepID=A0A923JT32_9PSED|nr:MULTISPECIES: hypothetical protein [Pseudomonas]MBC3376712.1 hypothetical protein [Pseudomonas sp. SWRI92]MBV4550979.1 hypothetical protein [Pseudomonas marvdashtae]
MANRPNSGFVCVLRYRRRRGLLGGPGCLSGARLTGESVMVLYLACGGG